MLPVFKKHLVLSGKRFQPPNRHIEWPMSDIQGKLFCRLSQMVLTQANPFPADLLADWVKDARRRTLVLVADLSDEQLMGPTSSILNPLLWEIGHVAWFGEKWVLRHANGRPPLRADADALYDSAAVAHDTRWGL